MYILFIEYNLSIMPIYLKKQSTIFKHLLGYSFVLYKELILMNIKNNKRKRESMEKITEVFIDLLQTQELHNPLASMGMKKY